MNRKLLLLSAATFLLLAPMAQLQIFGVESVVKSEGTSTTMVVRSDADITAAIKKALSSDTNLSKFVKDINVITNNGVVTLSGKVDSAKVKSDIGTKVQGVEGVKKVLNDIEVGVI